MKSLKWFFSFILGMGLLSIATISFALPFDITPLFLPSTIIKGEETFAYYKVVNSTTVSSPGNFVKFLPPNVKQRVNPVSASICGATFDLAPGASCILKLAITGSVDVHDPKPEHHLFVCRKNGKTCAGSAAQLNVTTVTLVSLSIQPLTASIPVATTQAFHATATFSNGSSRTFRAVKWNSSDASVATIDPLGVATGITVGGTFITATFGGVTSPPANLTVTAAPLVSISVTPVNLSIPVGTNLQYIATGTYADFSTHDITKTVTWSSSLPVFATIVASGSNAGLATGVSLGTTVITATDPSTPVTGNTQLTVELGVLQSISIVPQTVTIGIDDMQLFSAIGTFTSGVVSDISDTVTWFSSDTSVATINSIIDPGIATGLEVGNTTITAKLGMVTGTASLTVEPVVILPLFASHSSSSICISTDNGMTWPESGCVSVPEGPITSLAASNNLLYAGTGGSGSFSYICRSSNYVSWSCGFINQDIWSLAAFASNVYAGEGNGDVCISQDNAGTFPTCVNTGGTGKIIALAIDTDTEHLYAVRVLAGVYTICASPNRGTTWPSCVASPLGGPTLSLATDAGHVYASDNTSVCVSTDQGTTWPLSGCVDLAQGTVNSVSTQNGLVYAGTSNANVCVSYNHGASFPTCNPVDTAGGGTSVTHLAAHDTDVYAALLGTSNFCSSADQGTTWPDNLCSLIPGPAINALVVKVA